MMIEKFMCPGEMAAWLHEMSVLGGTGADARPRPYRSPHHEMPTVNDR